MGALIIKNGPSLIVLDEYPGDIFFVSTRLLLYGYLVTSDLPNGIKMKEAYAVLLSEWLLDVVVEDWHFLKWICKWITFQSYWVLSDTLQQHVWFHQEKILLWPKEQALAARYVHHSLPRRSCYFRWVIEWPWTVHSQADNPLLVMILSVFFRIFPFIQNPSSAGCSKLMCREKCTPS